MMYYIMHSFSINSGIRSDSSVGSILNLGSNVICIFSAIFLFYTNSFLIKRRKKELGLYSILGMEKKHISKILFFETIFIMIISIVLGLIAGIILSKLMFLILLNILNFSLPLVFKIEIASINITLLVFFVIFTMILLFNLSQIHFVNPIELLKGGQLGEKEPKSNLFITVIGIVTLGIGYAIAIVVKEPLLALLGFFIAVILVMVGTYCLFTSGSVVLLKILKKNKKFYYKTSHFVSLSSMIYRMKQNAVGLANICILSTAVLVMLSSTLSLYIGQEDLMRTRFPQDILITGKNITEEKYKQIEAIVEKDIKNNNIKVSDMIKYKYSQFLFDNYQDKFNPYKEESSEQQPANVYFITVDEYNRLENKNTLLNEDEVMVYYPENKYESDKFIVGDVEFKVKQKLDYLVIDKNKLNLYKNKFYIVVNNMDRIMEIIEKLQGEDFNKELNYHIGFNIDEEDEKAFSFAIELYNNINSTNLTARVESMHLSKVSFYALYGSLFFIGIFLGALFLMATVLIIYYKQISEGYDDKERFEIMQKVGMSKREIRKSIRSQIIIVFFIPLVVAVIHISVAFGVITKLLALMNLVNVSLFFLCTIVTILIFAIIYAFVYSMTARVYYKIVR